MQLGDADREQLFERLSHHHVAGHLDVPELERRVGLVAVATTHEEAAAALSDLPALPIDTSAPSRDRPRWGRGHGDADTPRAGWRPTNERFRDPKTNRVMRVWEDAGGTRHYVPDDQAP
ncbi:MAG TPA: DUF1707 domain-containing protein [Solirubrobacteraceae bacterium]|nr:DUF1707 domain-containing protein [Solirubrobacteraceae bacterium]